ncbi:galactose mutarotase [bacterium]|nr:galactose mutarotase [bacterium]
MIAEELFGRLSDGSPVWKHTLVNGRGIEVDIINLGASIVSIRMPDRNGAAGDIALGYDTAAAYEENPCYMGSIAGRYANRIRGGRVILDGHEHGLERNQGDDHLHGGFRGFSHRIWEGAPEPKTRSLVYRLVSADGDGGYPGRLSVTACYRLTDDNELEMVYRAETDAPTVLNLTNHTYFNLACGGTILDHLLQVEADAFTPVDDSVIPTGEIRPVAGTPFDFREPHAIGERIGEDDEQLRYGEGYNHNWVISRDSDACVPAARLVHPGTGRVLEVLTTEPGIQFYAGNSIVPEPKGKGGVRYEKRSGLCLETQHFPDSPNQPHFPSTVLRPGQRFESRTVFRFSVADR